MAIAVLDDPDGLVDELSILISGLSFVEPGSLAWTRHNILIRST